MAEFLLVVEAVVCADIMRIWTSGMLQLTHGVKALEESNYSMADSSEYSPNRPPELLSQDISGGMELLLAICWEFDHQKEWETWAWLKGK